MKVLIVDALSEGRVEPLIAYLRTRRHDVVHHSDQLNIVPGIAHPSPGWKELVHEKDIVFLHVGEQQKHAGLFFEYSLSALPVFCYTGSEPPWDIASACHAPGPRVVCPESLGRSREYGDRLLAVALRWLGPIDGRNDQERFVEAWHCIYNLDMVKEERLTLLEKKLAATLKQHSWIPAQQITDELRLGLQRLVTERERWEI